MYAGRYPRRHPDMPRAADTDSDDNTVYVIHSGTNGVQSATSEELIKSTRPLPQITGINVSCLEDINFINISTTNQLCHMVMVCT